MKLPGDPWNNRWSSFYGIAWNFSMEFHGKCPMHVRCSNFHEIGVLMFSMEFHGKYPNPPCKYFPSKSMEKCPWNSMEIDVLILLGIPWRFSHGCADCFQSFSEQRFPEYSKCRALSHFKIKNKHNKFFITHHS